MHIAPYFLDFEFHEDGRTIEPISMGLVALDGRELYLEFLFDEALVRRRNPWVAENVLPHLTWPMHERVTREEAARRIVDFVEIPHPAASKTRLEFWAYYADYDWVALCQIFGRMIDLPKHFPRYCMDLQQVFVQANCPAGVKPVQQGTEHHALADTRWNRDFYVALVRHGMIPGR